VTKQMDSESRTLRLYGWPTPDPTRAIGFLSSDPALTAVTFEVADQRDGEIVVTVRRASAKAWDRVVDVFGKRHAWEVFSTDGTTVDDTVAARLARDTVLTVESGTDGLLLARLTEAGVDSHSVDAMQSLLGLTPDEVAEVIATHGMVSPHCAELMAGGALALDDRRGVITLALIGVVDPGAGSDAVPAGTFCLSATGNGVGTITCKVQLQGGAAEVRKQAATLAMHALRVLRGPERLRVSTQVEI
jgi:nicotinamide-nucleotide amidase